jgi:hypothetical protein
MLQNSNWGANTNSARTAPQMSSSIWTQIAPQLSFGIWTETVLPLPHNWCLGSQLQLKLPFQCPLIEVRDLNSNLTYASTEVDSRDLLKESSRGLQRNHWLFLDEVRLLTRYHGNANLQQASYPWSWRVTLETCLCLITSKHVTVYFFIEILGNPELYYN